MSASLEQGDKWVVDAGAQEHKSTLVFFLNIMKEYLLLKEVILKHFNDNLKNHKKNCFPLLKKVIT